MATIDLIVLGIIKQQCLSAYDIQKLVEYRNISKWVKISTPSIYKKVIQLENKGLVEGMTVREGKMPEKVIYSLTEAGEEEFHKLMHSISEKPIQMFLDFNAIIVNLDGLPKDEQRECLDRIKTQVKVLQSYLQDNYKAKREDKSVPPLGLAVLQQQIALADTIDKWIDSLQE